MIATTRPELSVSEPTLYVAFELGKKDWKLAMTAGFGIEPWLRTVASSDLRAVARILAAGRARFGLPATARVVSCYEAGRDGFRRPAAVATGFSALPFYAFDPVAEVSELSTPAPVHSCAASCFTVV